MSHRRAAHHRRRSRCRAPDDAPPTFPAVTSDFVLPRVRPGGRSGRQPRSRVGLAPATVALTETTVPICFQVPAGTGDDYLSSIHPNAIDLDVNGPGTADDQLLVSGRHNDASLRDQLRRRDRRLEARGDHHASVAHDRRRSARRPAPSSTTSASSRTATSRCSTTAPTSRHAVPAFATGHRCGAVRRVRHRRDWPVPPRWCVRSATRTGSSPGATGSARVQPDGGVVICWGALPGFCLLGVQRRRSTSCSRCTCRGSTRATAR